MNIQITILSVKEIAPIKPIANIIPIIYVMLSRNFKHLVFTETLY